MQYLVCVQFVVSISVCILPTGNMCVKDIGKHSDTIFWKSLNGQANGHWEEEKRNKYVLIPVKVHNCDTKIHEVYLT